MRRSHAPLLQGEAAASTLPGWGAQSGAHVKKSEVPLKEYRYIDRDGERIAKFPVNRDDDVCGSVASASSPALTEYHDKLKCINFREQGLCKPEIADKLGRSERWVKRWWRETPALIERPGGEMLQKAALASFRDVDIRRRFLSEDEEHSLFRAADNLLAWKPAKIVRRDSESGGLALAYDQKGNSITDRRGRLVADYKGGIDGLDKLLQRIFSTMQIRDPQARIFLNHYKDGAVTIGTHRHDHWSLVVSLGAERILMVDNKPVLTRNGDLVNFGTQSHSVPSMPDSVGGRISLVVFYYPDSDNMERRRWRTIADGEEESVEEEEMEKDAGYNPGAQKLKSSADSSWNVSILWGEVGTGGHGATALSSAKTSSGALAQSLTVSSAPNSQINSGESNRVASVCPTTVFTLGVGSVASEREFFMLLTGVEAQHLWDLRSPEVLRSNVSNFSEPDVLKRSCAVRCITYHSVPLGRRAAGGIEGHIVSDEGRDVVAKLLSAARNGPPLALLGGRDDWRPDDRRVVCDALTLAGGGSVCIEHLLRDGGRDTHPSPPAISSMSPTVAMTPAPMVSPPAAKVAAPTLAAPLSTTMPSLQPGSGAAAGSDPRPASSQLDSQAQPDTTKSVAPRRRRWGS